jgi:tetratricopeptide (TPR) repeat protein
VAAPDADDKSRQVCLTAIWFADHIDDQPEILLRLSDEMMARGEVNENVHYRRAAALRRLGRYDEALSEIDLAIELFGVGNVVVHEQYAQERRTIITTRDMRKQATETAAQLATELSARIDERIDEASAAMETRIKEASDHLAQRVAVAQELVSEGLLKMVEVLGLFVTLLGFLIGSGAVIIKADTFQERAVSMGIVTVGAVVFFALLRLVVSVRRRRRSA